MTLPSTSQSFDDRSPERDAALLAGQRRVLELLARGEAFRRTLTALCEVIEARIPSAHCSVLLLDASRRYLNHGAAPRLPAAYCNAIDGAIVGPATGSCGTAAFLGRSVVVEDIASDPRWADYRHLALPHELRACASTPIFDAQRAVLGTFAIYHSYAGQFDPRELGVLHDFTGLATLVIETEARRVALAEAEAALLQSQKLDSLGVLAGGLAHDFNNLLAAMLGNLNLAELNLSPAAPAMVYVKNVEAAVLRAADLTKQMLAYSGKGRFLVRPLDLSEVVLEMSHLLSVALPKKVAMRHELSLQLPLIEGDVAQMQQVVMNLVTNAAEAIGEAEGEVQISTGVSEIDEAGAAEFFFPRRLAPGRYVTLAVSDTGCGMTAEVRGRIFDPFFTTKKAGRGLGLSATLGILRVHQAGLRLRSEPGEGSTFELYFPASTAPRAAAIEEVERGPQVAPSGLALVVDDDPAIRQSSTRALRMLGFEVVTAEDGLDAIERVREHAGGLTLVLMDLTMPRLSGVEALAEIRKIEPDLPVILCSGYSTDELRESCPAQALVEFLQKPYQLRELEQAVHTTLKRGRTITAAEPRTGC